MACSAPAARRFSEREVDSDVLTCRTHFLTFLNPVDDHPFSLHICRPTRDGYAQTVEHSSTRGLQPAHHRGSAGFFRWQILRQPRRTTDLSFRLSGPPRNMLDGNPTATSRREKKYPKSAVGLSGGLPYTRLMCDPRTVTNWSWTRPRRDSRSYSNSRAARCRRSLSL